MGVLVNAAEEDLADGDGVSRRYRLPAPVTGDSALLQFTK